MGDVRIADLKARLSEHLRSVRKGATLTVLDRDTPVARIVPYSTPALEVRKAQRQYVEIWVDVLRQLDDSLSEADARLMAHATFGLLNSTPHSVKPGAAKAAEAGERAVLRAMTVAALTSAGRANGG